MVRRMSMPLSHFARLLLGDEASAHAAVSSPVLVWEAAYTGDREKLKLETKAGMHERRPKAGDPLVFEIRKGHSRANAFAMGVTVGRTDANDVTFEHESVSRFHAYFQQDLRTGAWKLVDAESKNGTWLGPLRLGPNKGEQLASGARLRFGDIEVLYFEPPEFFAYLAEMMRR
jgi:hypothetical protein